MTRFDESRLDGDPTYAPGRCAVGPAFYWRPPKTDVREGYKIKAFRLSGSDDDQAAKCRELTRELLRWRNRKIGHDKGTWGWIITKFKSDEISPIHDVKANTRASYMEEVGYWQATIADAKVAATDFATLRRWKKAMEDKGRSPAFIKRKFTHLRIVASYGLAVDPPMFRDVCSVLESGALKLRAPKPRTTAPTSDQIMAIISAADAAGNTAFALGLSLQWWLTLRAVDVRGQWLDTGRERRWADGLTWDMIDLHAGTITKMISKTERHDDFEMVWELAPLPDLWARLSVIPKDQRVGPVLKKDNGNPFEVRQYRDLFRRFAAKAGVPPQVLLMDTRAGAINDALRSGAGKLDLQHAANHKSFDTTERYIRSRDEGANKVIALRAGTKQ